jgi:hypothetical protein
VKSSELAQRKKAAMAKKGAMMPQVQGRGGSGFFAKFEW